ncbi:MAG: ClpXP protease specificity-enhancing factor SspB [Polyangiaceae bacterium]
MSDAPRRLPPKKDVAITLLEGPSVFVHLDPRRPGVSVPKWFARNPQLVLQVGLNMAIPIPDLKVDEDGISCTLSFSRTPFWCKLPWSAVYALVGEDGRGMIWPNDVPPEVSSQMQKAATPVAKTPAKKPRTKLSSLVSERDGRASASERDGRSGPASERDGRSERDRGPADGEGRRSRKGDGDSAAHPEAAARPEPEAARRRAEPAADADGEGSADTGRASAPPPAPGRKPRRELPPYLRVIK